jgi:hypothetical protein
VSKRAARAPTASYPRVRAAALALAGVSELETWGRPTFRVGKELFAALHDELLILRSKPQDQKHLLADRRFRVAPYWGRYGWVAIQLNSVDSDSELASLLERAWRLVSVPAAKP